MSAKHTSAQKKRYAAAARARRAVNLEAAKMAEFFHTLDYPGSNLAPASLATQPAPAPLPLADQLLREKLDALRAAESHLEGKKSIASMLREKADKAGADYNEATNAVHDYKGHVEAAVKEVGLLLAERHDIFEFDGWFYVPAGPGRFNRYSAPVKLS